MDPQDLENINALLDRDVELRDKIKDQVAELDKKTRTIVGLINKVHSTPPESLPALLDSARPVLLSCQVTNKELAALIPENQFWRWKDMWSISLRTAIYSAALIQYLSNGTLITLPQVAETLGIKEEWKDRLVIPPEDYLHGLISLVNELVSCRNPNVTNTVIRGQARARAYLDYSRLAVNSVTLGNFQEPIRISIFVKDLFVGFSMLNLKNDILRRRFDSLKYDIKKIEEVVYDVSLRNLVTPQTAPRP